MKTIILILLPFFGTAQKKIEWRGMYAGAQTISTVKKIDFSHSAYVIAIVGYKRLNFNTQFIIPVYPKATALIKFGMDYKIL